MDQLGSVDCAWQLFWITKAAELDVEETACAVNVADAAANEKLSDHGRNAGSILQGGHACRIVTRNAPAFRHLAQGGRRKGEGGRKTFLRPSTFRTPPSPFATSSFPCAWCAYGGAG